MNNKGFTLVELLAVLLILVSISLVAVGEITASLTRRDTKECVEQQELAINAAKIYFSLNKNVKSVTVNTLINGKYITSDEKVSKLSTRDSITLSGSKYVFSGTKCE